MSSKYYGENGLGLVIPKSDDAFMTIMERVAEETGNELETDDVYELEEDEIYDSVDYLRNHVCEALYYGEDEVTSVTPAFKERGEYLENEDIIVFWADKTPDAFIAVYTEESIVEEFRKKVGKYLPDNFDYLAHIGYFSCTVYS